MDNMKLGFYIYQELLLSMPASTKYFVSFVEGAAGWVVHDVLLFF